MDGVFPTVWSTDALTWTEDHLALARSSNDPRWDNSFGVALRLLLLNANDVFQNRMIRPIDLVGRIQSVACSISSS